MIIRSIVKVLIYQTKKNSEKEASVTIFEIETAIHEYTTPQLSRHVTNVDEVTAARVHKISLYFLLPEFGVSIAGTLSCVLYLFTIIEK